MTKAILHQEMLMKQALECLRTMRLLDSLFAKLDKPYGEKLVKEKQEEYATIMTFLVQDVTQSVNIKQQ